MSPSQASAQSIDAFKAHFKRAREAKPVLVILSIGTNFNPAIPGASNPSICTNFNPTISGAPNPPGKNRVKVEFAHGPHNLYLSIAVEIVLQGNLLYSVIIGTLK